MKNKTSQPVYSATTAWLLSHVRACRYALNELKQTPIINFITICVISIAITLPLGFFVVIENLQVVNTQWNTNAPTISLYLKSDIDSDQVSGIMQTLQENPQIDKVSYISPQDGLRFFQKNTSFGDVVSLFQHNPIPGVITILPARHYRNPAAINALFHSLKTLPVVDVAQLDINWVTRLFDVVAIGKKISRALSLLFGFGVILIIGNTLRSTLSSHIDEVRVMRLVGANNAYIRRPLLYRGVLYGLLGGILAWILTAIFMAELQRPVSRLAQTYQTQFHLQNISFLQGTSAIFIAGILGLVGAWVIITQFLAETEQLD